MTPVRLRPSAKLDLAEEADYYATRVGAEWANTFVDEALQALDTLGAQPGIGSPRWSEPGQVPVLRSWRVSRFHSV